MGVKTAGVGHFQIPTAPAAGTSVTSAAANNYTANAVQLIASTAAALYITGVHVESSAALAATYISVQLMIGAGGAETNLGQYLVPLQTGSTVALGFRPIFPPIPVASGQRISVKTADSVGSKATLISIECIAQSNVVDDGIAVTSVTTVGSVTGAVGSVTGAVGSVTGAVGSVTARVTANADQFGGQTVTAAAGVTVPASIASPTNITAGVITTVTNLTNAPTAGDLTATMKTSVTTAATAATPTAAAVTGAVGSVTAAVTVGTNNDKTGYALSAAGVTAVWAEVMAGTTTAVKAMRGFMAALLGKASGLNSNAPVYRDIAD
ncbi:MAG: hypothetical protein ABI039_07770, partial [Vicinamibacterales bacterium]